MHAAADILWLIWHALGCYAHGKYVVNLVLSSLHKLVACLQDVRNKLVGERARLIDQLQQMKMLHPYQSSANFVLCEVTNGYDAKDVKLALAKQGVMVRHYAQKELCGYIRISVGKPQQTDKLLSVLKQL